MAREPEAAGLIAASQLLYPRSETTGFQRGVERRCPLKVRGGWLRQTQTPVKRPPLNSSTAATTPSFPVVFGANARHWRTVKCGAPLAYSSRGRNPVDPACRERRVQASVAEARCAFRSRGVRQPLCSTPARKRSTHMTSDHRSMTCRSSVLLSAVDCSTRLRSSSRRRRSSSASHCWRHKQRDGRRTRARWRDRAPCRAACEAVTSTSSFL
jgi:hypothetical protein